MKVLLIKTSSMGDLIHTLPALSDAALAIPGIQFDWVVENAFAEIPQWHATVENVIPIHLRKWLKNLFAKETRNAFNALRKQLADTQYDLVLDAQGLMKSALLTYFANGVRVGLDFHSARESFAAFVYQRKCTVNFYQHAIPRMRLLFSQALGYALPSTLPNFGLKREQFQINTTPERHVVFLHGTTWESKQWPESYWLQLAKIISAAGLRIKISGGNEQEVARAFRIAAECKAVDVLPYLNIQSMAQLLANAHAVVSVDTGFGHLAAALSVPTISIYGSTNADYTGALGSNSVHLSADFSCSPCLKRTCHYKSSSVVKPACYELITPEKVWSLLYPSLHPPHQAKTA